MSTPHRPVPFPACRRAPYGAALGLVAGLLCAGCDSSAAVTSLRITAASPVVVKGSTTQLTAVGMLPDGTSTNLTYQAQWTSSNAAVASVSTDGANNGLVLGLGSGTATIRARFNGLTGSMDIQVR